MSVFKEFLKLRATIDDFWSIIFGIAFSGAIFVLLNFLKCVKRRAKYTELLPGVKVSYFDLFGNLNVIPLKEVSRNGYSVQAFALQVIEGTYKLFQNEGLFCVWVSYHPFVFLVNPEAIEIASKDPTLLDKSWFYKFFIQFFGEGLVTSPYNKWRSRRKLLNPCLHLDILMEFIPIFNKQACQLVRNLQNGIDDEIRDLFKPISLCILDITCETILGVKIGAQDNKNTEYVHAIENIGMYHMERVVNWWSWPDFIFRFTESGRNLKRNVKIAHDFTNKVLQQKKKEYLSRGPDASPRKQRKALMDLLLEHHMERQSISEEDIREEVDTFTAAADDTTSIAILLVLYFLGQHKNVQDNVRQELDGIFGEDKERPVEKEDLKDLNYLECVIKETLRLHPSVPMYGRNMPEEKIICGYKVPKGASLAVCSYILHRNPAIFPDPEKFDPTRFLPENSAKRHPYAYVPFSAGPRNCIGQKFAMIEMKIIVSTILRNFTVKSMPTSDKFVPSPEITLRTSVPLGFLLKRM